MRASDLRTNNNQSFSGSAQPQGSPKLAPLAALAVVLMLGLIVFVAVRLSASETPAPLPGVPERVVGSRKVVLRDYADRKWLKFYDNYKDMLGEPIWQERPFDIHSACVGFEYYIACHSNKAQDQATIWEFQLLLLGVKYLPPGAVPNDQAQLDPVVVGFISELERAGVDRWYFLGAVQAPAYCSNSGECYQVFQRQVLRWKVGATDPQAVSLSKLGLEQKS